MRSPFTLSGEHEGSDGTPYVPHEHSSFFYQPNKGLPMKSKSSAARGSVPVARHRSFECYALALFVIFGSFCGDRARGDIIGGQVPAAAYSILDLGSVIGPTSSV